MELAVTVVGILGGLFALYKVITEVTVFRSGKRREEYEFSKRLISDLDNENVYRLTLEKGFLALTGKVYPVEEIRLLLTGKDPSLSIKDRASAASYVRFNPEANSYSWKGVFRRTFIRKHALKWYFFWYAVTASLALTPIYIKGFSALSDWAIVMFSGSLFLLAVMCLFSAENFKSATRLMAKFGRGTGEYLLSENPRHDCSTEA